MVTLSVLARCRRGIGDVVVERIGQAVCATFSALTAALALLSV